MRTRISKLAAGVAALAALAVGGATLASANGNGTPVKAPAAASQVANVKDGGNVQQGDQTSPDTAKGSADEIDSSSEQAGDTTESGSEVPGNDGPSGHADEPGNPTADNQFEGVQ